MREILACVLALTTFGHSQTKPSAKPGDPPSKALMAAILVPFSDRTPEAAAPFYDKSARNVFFDVAPLQYKGWDAYLAGVKEVIAGFETFKLTLRDDDTTVHMAGSGAWATATFTMDGKMKNGNRLSVEGRWTCIWQKKGSKWLIVHEHVSFPWAPESESRQR